MMNFEVGQTLWWEYEDAYSNAKRRGYEVTITKVGRSWLHLDNNHRIDKKTLMADGKGYPSPAKCYLSKKDCDEELLLIKEWDLIRRKIYGCYSPPKDVSIEQLKQAREILGL
jgi:hypothetical protein